MAIYSSKTQRVRSVTIEPNELWGGQGLLGVSIRFCSFEGANENVWHVLEVHPSSPAELAGLKSFTDYIIGSDSVLHESEDLFALIEAHEARSLKLYVYDSTDDTCREVTIIPNTKWGGEGSLGCGIGYGYLHRIPVRITPPDTTVTTTIYKQLANQKPTETVLNSNIIEPSQVDVTGTNQHQDNTHVTLQNQVSAIVENQQHALQSQLPGHMQIQLSGHMQTQLPNKNFQTTEPNYAIGTLRPLHENLTNPSVLTPNPDAKPLPNQIQTPSINSTIQNVPNYIGLSNSTATIPSSNLTAFTTSIPNIPTIPSTVTNLNQTASLSYPIQPNFNPTVTNVNEQPSSIPMYNPNMIQHGSTFPIQTTSTLFYDPDIAEKSARQILTNERMSK